MRVFKSLPKSTHVRRPMWHNKSLKQLVRHAKRSEANHQAMLNYCDGLATECQLKRQLTPKTLGLAILMDHGKLLESVLAQQPNLLYSYIDWPLNRNVKLRILPIHLAIFCLASQQIRSALKLFHYCHYGSQEVKLAIEQWRAYSKPELPLMDISNTTYIEAIAGLEENDAFATYLSLPIKEKKSETFEFAPLDFLLQHKSWDGLALFFNSISSDPTTPRLPVCRDIENLMLRCLEHKPALLEQVFNHKSLFAASAFDKACHELVNKSFQFALKGHALGLRQVCKLDETRLDEIIIRQGWLATICENGDADLLDLVLARKGLIKAQAAINQIGQALAIDSGGSINKEPCLLRVIQAGVNPERLSIPVNKPTTPFWSPSNAPSTPLYSAYHCALALYQATHALYPSNGIEHLVKASQYPCFDDFLSLILHRDDSTYHIDKCDYLELVNRLHHFCQQHPNAIGNDNRERIKHEAERIWGNYKAERNLLTL